MIWFEKWRKPYPPSIATGFIDKTIQSHKYNLIYLMSHYNAVACFVFFGDINSYWSAPSYIFLAVTA